VKKDETFDEDGKEFLKREHRWQDLVERNKTHVKIRNPLNDITMIIVEKQIARIFNRYTRAGLAAFTLSVK